MLKEVRHSRIRDLLDERGELRISEINRALDVSEATIRRDLDELASQGRIRRTHGGALRVDIDHEPPRRLREETNSGEKDLIAKAAASQICDGETIFLGSGTTVASMVPYLHGRSGLRVITNSLPVILQLVEREDVELIIIGGLFRHSEGSMVSPLADEAISKIRADRVFMGIRGLDAERGFTNSSIDEATTDRTILRVADHHTILADHSKFGQVSTFQVAAVSDISVVITSKKAAEPALSAIRDKGVQILFAEDVIS